MTTVKFQRIYGNKPCRSISKKQISIGDSSINEYDRQKPDTIFRFLYGPESVIEETDSSNSEIDRNEDFVLNFNIPFNLLDRDDSHNLDNIFHPDIVPLDNPDASSVFLPQKRKKIKKNKVQHGLSHNFVDFLFLRSVGMLKNPLLSIQNGFSTRQTASKLVLKENVIKLPLVNKIFCSQWLTDDQILMGTKSNNLLVYNIRSQKSDYIPTLQRSTPTPSHYEVHNGGVQCMAVNPSKNMIATAASNSYDVAVYKLPTLDPLCIGEQAHFDLIFDISWLDDLVFMSVSRDNSMALWNVSDIIRDNKESPHYGSMKPFAKRTCRTSDKLRALVFNKKHDEAVTLSFNSRLHVFDTRTLRQVISQRLEVRNENVCLAVNDSCSLYAVGSKTEVSLIDSRNLQTVRSIDITKTSVSVRSLSFQGDVLTMGTGVGNILIFDINTNKFISNDFGPCILKCSKSDVVSTSQFDDCNSADSAIYTHCYDWTGTRLFAAGGPLSSIYWGSYAALWS